MNTNLIIASVAVFAIAFGGLFYMIYQSKQSDDTQVVVSDVVATSTPIIETAPPAPFGINRIYAQHAFADGVHTLVGELSMPTPCELLETEAVVAESFPEQVTIDFTVINEDADTCIQVITPARFKVEVAASEDASFTATLQGQPIIFNRIPASEESTNFQNTGGSGSGGNPQDFEVFIKG